VERHYFWATTIDGNEQLSTGYSPLVFVFLGRKNLQPVINHLMFLMNNKVNNKEQKKWKEEEVA
jgi:hypothetical protein